MDRITGTFAALALGVGVTLALVGSAVAQPKEGCEIATPGETDYQAQASEQYAETSPPTGAEKGSQTPNPDSGATAEAKGSESAARVGMGECDEIEDLSTKTEG